MDAIARSALGPAARQMDAASFARFRDAMTGYIARKYGRRFQEFLGSRIEVGAAIMMVATAARHRRAAFDAADFLMDWLKSRAPFWKREIGPEGPRGWVSAKDEDEAALGRW